MKAADYRGLVEEVISTLNNLKCHCTPEEEDRCLARLKGCVEALERATLTRPNPHLRDMALSWTRQARDRLGAYPEGAPYFLHQILLNGSHWKSEVSFRNDRDHAAKNVNAGWLNGEPRWAATISGYFIYGLDARAHRIYAAPTA